jgi:hypothetical protein
MRTGMLPGEFVRRAFTGGLGAAGLEREVQQRWRRGDFIHHLGPGGVPTLPPSRERLDAYGTWHGLTTDVLFGQRGEAGCLLVGTPPQPALDESLRSFLVPPHVHWCHHASLVTGGEARFLVVRDTGAGAVLVVERVVPGSLIYVTAGTPHTFITRRGFEVASLHARWLGADRADFAQDSDLDLSVLPRMSFGEFRRAADSLPA